MKNKDTLISQLIGFTFFMLLAIIAVIVFLDVFKPKSFLKDVNISAYEKNALNKTLNVQEAEAKLKKVLQLGSRSIGQQGFYDCEKFIQNYYKEADLDVYRQSFRTAFPQTTSNKILDEKGKELAGVTIYPFFPNYVQPMNTPENGYTGKLLVLTDEVIDTTKDFTDIIGIIDMAEVPPKRMGFNWLNYASLGFKALIVANSEGMDKVKFGTLGAMNSYIPVNYIRLFATKEILKFNHKKVTLKVNVKFSNFKNSNVVGILKGDNKNDDIIIIPVFYDGYSPFTDLNPGQFNATQLAVQLCLLDGLKKFKRDIKRDIAFVAVGAGAMGMDGMNRFITAIGNYGQSKEAGIRQEDELDNNKLKEALVDKIIDLLKNEKFLADSDETEKIIDSVDDATREFLIKEFRYTANTIVFNDSEKLLKARINFMKDETKNTEAVPFKKYRAAKKRNDKLTTIAAYPIIKFLRTVQKENFKYHVPIRKIFHQRIHTLLRITESTH